MKYRVKIRAKAVGATCDQLAEIKHIKAEGKILLVRMEGNEESKTIDVNYHLLYNAMNKKVLVSNCYWERIKDN